MFIVSKSNPGCWNFLMPGFFIDKKIILNYSGGMKKIIEIIKSDGIGVLPTDTLYGLVGSAFSKKAVRRIYTVKKRNPKKPLIVLISSIDDLKLFDIKVDEKTSSIFEKVWPGKVSVILPSKNKKYSYLQCETKSISFRFPKNKKLIEILKKTGPLVAPSANPESFPPAKNILEAKKYFGDRVDFYIAGGTLKSEPSTLIEIKNGKIKIIRQGVTLFKKSLTF